MFCVSKRFLQLYLCFSARFCCTIYFFFFYFLFVLGCFRAALEARASCSFFFLSFPGVFLCFYLRVLRLPEILVTSPPPQSPKGGVAEGVFLQAPGCQIEGAGIYSRRPCNELLVDGSKCGTPACYAEAFPRAAMLIATVQRHN